MSEVAASTLVEELNAPQRRMIVDECLSTSAASRRTQPWLVRFSLRLGRRWSHARGEGTSFKLLRDTLLQDLAEQALADGVRTGRIAEDLGFSDESAFAKAFKRWTGRTPARFREAPPG